MSRFTKTPTGKIVVLNERDQVIFDHLRRFGPLPTHYIHALVGGSYKGLYRRLDKLYDDTPYITRPPDQRRSPRSNSLYLTSMLTPLGWEHTTIKYPNPPRDPIAHRFMRSTISASIYLSLPEGYRFIDQQEIFTHEKCTNPSLSFPLSNGSWLEPDDLFGIEWTEQGTKRFRFFALEADKATESIYASNIEKSSYGKKLSAYADILYRRSFREQWGIPNLRVLTVTTAEKRVENMKLHLRKVTDKTDPFIFIAKDVFAGPEWKVPPIMTDITPLLLK